MAKSSRIRRIWDNLGNKGKALLVGIPLAIGVASAVPETRPYVFRAGQFAGEQVARAAKAVGNELENEVLDPAIMSLSQHLDEGNFLENYLDPVERGAVALQRHGYDLSANDLVFLTRLLVTEGEMNGSNQYLRNSYLAIASTLKNRLDFDLEHNVNRFNGKKGGIMGVAKQRKQYSALDEDVFKEYFKRRTFTDEHGDHVLAGKRRLGKREVSMNSRKAQLAYQALMDVLLEKAIAPTRSGRPLSYKRDYVKQTWDGDHLASVGKKQCHLKYDGMVGTHEFFRGECQ